MYKAGYGLMGLLAASTPASCVVEKRGNVLPEIY
jgi:hypothetical protein